MFTLFSEKSPVLVFLCCIWTVIDGVVMMNDWLTDALIDWWMYWWACVWSGAVRASTVSSCCSHQGHQSLTGGTLQAFARCLHFVWMCHIKQTDASCSGWNDWMCFRLQPAPPIRAQLTNNHMDIKQSDNNQDNINNKSSASWRLMLLWENDRNKIHNWNQIQV